MEPILKAKGLTKRYGKVTALNNCDFELYPGEILAVIGDNGAGKSTLIKAVSGAVIPDEGQIWLDGQEVSFKTPIEARAAGIETVYQTLAMSPALSIADNMFMGREMRKPGLMGSLLRQLDRPAMERIAREKLNELGLMTIQNINQAVETLSGGQRQRVAIARACCGPVTRCGRVTVCGLTRGDSSWSIRGTAISFSIGRDPRSGRRGHMAVRRAWL